jgi:hypothetical protein
MPVAPACNLSRIAVWSQPRQIVHETLSQNNPSQQRDGKVAKGAGPDRTQIKQTETKHKNQCFSLRYENSVVESWVFKKTY